MAEKIIAKKKIAWINTDLEQAGYRPRFNRPFYEQMSTICTVSEALYRKLPDDGFLDEERLIIIKDILNVKMIREMADAPFKSNFFNNPIKLLTVGRLVPQKNYPLAVRTAEILQKKGLDFTWVFVGEGQEEDSIIRLIDRLGLKNRIVLAGQQDNPYPFFKYCDIYVHTSSVEGFGLTLSEAKILHKPIVTTNFPSAYDQIADGENGIIAQMTPESVADKILLLVDNPSLVARLIDATKRDENHTAETESALVNQLLTED